MLAIGAIYPITMVAAAQHGRGLFLRKADCSAASTRLLGPVVARELIPRAIRD
jgi:hypothetical protein